MLYDAIESKLKLFCNCNFYIFISTLFNKAISIKILNFRTQKINMLLEVYSDSH